MEPKEKYHYSMYYSNTGTEMTLWGEPGKKELIAALPCVHYVSVWGLKETKYHIELDPRYDSEEASAAILALFE